MENLPITELPVIISEVNKNLSRYTLRSLNPDHQYFICFDQLDLGFEPDNPNYYNRLIGLILAARDLNNLAKEYGKKFLVVIFLRDDIYEMLHFEDKNKITENFQTLIEWDTPRTINKLKNLMEKRFSAVLGGSKKWEDLFDEDHEMPGHQSKYQFITDRTFLRPRDIIKFSNTILESYKKRINEGKTLDKLFINQDIHDARAEYGRYFLREMDDEIHKHIDNYEIYFDLLKGIGVYRFKEDKFIAEFNNIKSRLPDSIYPMQILKELYEFSILGFYKRGGKGFGGSEYIFKYKDPTQNFDEAAGLFQVHLGLLDVLGLKRYEKK